MKKFILGIIAGLFLTTTAVYAAYQYKASDVSYKRTNVSSALDELYDVYSSFHIITFDSQGGSRVKSIVREHDQEIGELTKSTKDGYNFVGWYTEPNGRGTKINSTTKIDRNITLYAHFGSVWEFSYKSGNNKEQSFTVHRPGKYKLEVWGAQGGTYNSSTIGGYGGYSVGIVSLKENDVLYINVGGKGVDTNTNGTNAGGYNGGGDSYVITSSCSNYGGSGGGATHIATVQGQLSALSSYRNTGGTNISNEILIVAGGGGGSIYRNCNSNDIVISSGGSGGGHTGVSSIVATDTWNYSTSKGGTQTAGGTGGTTNYESGQATGGAGIGGQSTRTGGYTDAPGGGGGWYGGGSGMFMSGGGGSGYIKSPNLISSNGITKHMVCFGCTKSDDASEKTIPKECHNGEANEDCSKEGNGFARITYLEN